VRMKFLLQRLGVGPDRGPLLRIIAAHSGRVNAIALSDASPWVVSGSEDHMVRVWDLSSGQLLHTLSGHSAAVRAVAMSASGEIVVSGGRDHIVRVWNARAGTLEKVLRGYRKWVNAVAVSRSGAVAVSGAADGSVTIWDIPAGVQRHRMPQDGGPIRGVALHPGEVLAFSGASDGSIAVWDIASGARLRTLSLHCGAVWSIAVSRDGRLLFSGGADKTIRVWDARSGEALGVFDDHHDKVLAVAVTALGEVVSGAGDGEVRVSRFGDARSSVVLGRHGGSVRALAVHSEGGVVVSGSSDCNLKVWNLTGVEEETSPPAHNGPVVELVLGSDARMLLSLGSDNSIIIWDLDRLIGIHKLHLNETPFAVSPDGTFCIKPELPSSGNWTSLAVRDAAGHRSSVIGPFPLGVDLIVISADGRRLLSCSHKGDFLELWELASRKKLRAFSSGVEDAVALGIDATGHFATVRERNGRLLLLDLNDGNITRFSYAQGGPAHVGVLAIQLAGRTLHVREALTSFETEVTMDDALTVCTQDPCSNRIFVGDQTGRVHFFRFVSPGHDTSPCGSASDGVPHVGADE
jgi:WD40 repeat protein